MGLLRVHWQTVTGVSKEYSTCIFRAKQSWLQTVEQHSVVLTCKSTTQTTQRQLANCFQLFVL